jgi:hypothetical protein
LITDDTFEEDKLSLTLVVGKEDSKSFGEFREKNNKGMTMNPTSKIRRKKFSRQVRKRLF